MGWDNVYLMQNLRDTLVQKKPIDMELGRTGYSEDPEYYLAACYIFDHPEMLEMNEFYSVCVWVGDVNLFRPLRVGNWTPEVHDGNEPRWVRYERQPDEVIKSIYNLLCDFAENVLIKKGYCVLYYNAAEFVGDPWNYLMRNLTLEESYTKEYIFKALEQNYNKQQKPIMVLIDGLNENGSENFGTLMRDFLQKCEFVPKLKVMMTTREELFEERFSMIQQGEYTGKIKIIHMDRPGKNELFADRIFDGYMKHFHITISRRTERAYKTLTQDTLLLRFFAEVYEGRKSVDLYDIYKYPLFTKYI